MKEMFTCSGLITAPCGVPATVHTTPTRTSHAIQSAPRVHDPGIRKDDNLATQLMIHYINSYTLNYSTVSCVGQKYYTHPYWKTAPIAL